MAAPHGTPLNRLEAHTARQRSSSLRMPTTLPREAWYRSQASTGLHNDTKDFGGHMLHVGNPKGCVNGGTRRFSKRFSKCLAIFGFSKRFLVCKERKEVVSPASLAKPGRDALPLHYQCLEAVVRLLFGAHGEGPAISLPGTPGKM